MKTKSCLSFVFLASGLLALQSWATERAEVAFPPENTVAAAANTMVEKPRITAGTTQSDVLARIGEPTLRLSPNEWVYRDVRATQPNKGELSHDNLIVSFANDRVSGLKLVKRPLLRHLIADAKRIQPEQRQAPVIADNTSTGSH
jgi:hypothetical protein